MDGTGTKDINQVKGRMFTTFVSGMHRYWDFRERAKDAYEYGMQTLVDTGPDRALAMHIRHLERVSNQAGIAVDNTRALMRATSKISRADAINNPRKQAIVNQMAKKVDAFAESFNDCTPEFILQRADEFVREKRGRGRGRQPGF